MTHQDHTVKKIYIKLQIRIAEVGRRKGIFK